MDIKNIKINPTAISKNILGFLNKKSRWIIIIIAISLLGYCAFLWYNYITNPRWSDARRQDYINSKQNGVLFNEAKFDAVIGDVENKRVEYQKNIDNVPDIFRLK